MRPLVLVGALVLGSCVPATADTDPAGGADVMMVPSAATTGSPFVTPDGWTVTIRHFVMRAMASDATSTPGANDYSGGGLGPWGVVAASSACHLRVTGAADGDLASISLGLAQVFPKYIDTPLDPCGVDDAIARRFEQVDDVSLAFGYEGQLPNVYLVADAVKGARHIGISAAVSMAGLASPLNTVFVTIKANTGAPVWFPVNAEAIFIARDSFGVSMDEIAATDENGDGIVTGVELAVAMRACVIPTDLGDTSNTIGDDDDSALDPNAQPRCPTVLDDIIGQNGTALFGDGRKTPP